MIARVSTLFNGHNNLIQGFNTFLPQGYRIECSSDPSDPNPIRVTTPSGTTSRPDGEPTIPYDGRWQQQQQQQVDPNQGYMNGSRAGNNEPNGVHDATNGMGSMSQLHAAANDTRPAEPAEARRPGDPVEFNHAIGYVNKIKTRFASQPDVYKTFLEILQTYQREQLRIAEVYTQITALFQDAPDLLDDFQQFLPDMTQQRPSDTMLNDNVRLPPVGSFAPPAVGGSQQAQIPPMGTPGASQASTASGRSKKKGSEYNGQYDKNVAVSNLRSAPSKPKDGLISPTLVPATPEPLHPSTPGVVMEEISFFDKAKKHIGNKQTYNEFLKVLNLFSQRVIDKAQLVERVDKFLDGNKELFDWFKAFVKYEATPMSIENIPYKKHLLKLSMCRSYGKSYRLLPKSETYMPSSGRDEMCWEVLNDEWVGHPTWASEEAGFVAHRKNQYEEIMHKVEEERHEYDYYMGSNLRTIQTLETLASRIANMTADEKVMFKLPANLGHTSTIYEKVLKKIYGEGRYHEVVEALRDSPAVSIPIVLRRLKQKDEEWRQAHREWNKIWRETEQKVFFKSLDHRGLTFKQTDKKFLTTRQLVSQIMTVKAEQNNKRLNSLTPKPKEQLEYHIKDNAILIDMFRLVVCFLDHSTYSNNDRESMEQLMKLYLNLFFSLPEDYIDKAVPRKCAEKEEDVEKSEESAQTNGKRPLDSDSELLRDLLKKSKHAKLYKPREELEEEEEEEKTREEEEMEAVEKSGELWLKHITATSEGDVFEERPRHTFNLFANTTMYVFFRLTSILYERLEEVKGFEKEVSQEIGGSRKTRYAVDLGLYDNRIEEMGLEFEKDDCYGQLLKMVEKLLEGDLEHQWYEEAIRQAYRNRAYKLYTIDKVLQSIVKHLHTIISDSKSSDVLVLFEADRACRTSSVKKQILYRMRVDSVLGADENLFRIEWNEKTRHALVKHIGSDDITLKQIKTQEEKWNYYLTSYLMTCPTEGVPADKVSLPFLHRSLPDSMDTDDVIAAVDQGLTARICDSTYKLFFEPNSEDFFSRKVGAAAEGASDAAKQQMQENWKGFLEGPHGWRSDIDEDAVEEAQSKFDAWKNQGPDAVLAWEPPVKPDAPVEEPSEDVTMTEDQDQEKDQETADTVMTDAKDEEAKGEEEESKADEKTEEVAEEKPVEKAEDKSEQQTESNGEVKTNDEPKEKLVDEKSAEPSTAVEESTAEATAADETTLQDNVSKSVEEAKPATDGADVQEPGKENADANAEKDSEKLLEAEPATASTETAPQDVADNDAKASDEAKEDDTGTIKPSQSADSSAQ